jgi:RNA polymerase sigma factor (sigma-70 family)
MAARPQLGDEAELFRTHDKRLRRVIARKISASAATVEDACAFAWMQLVSCQPERGERLLSWLITVAYHEALRLVAAERRTQLSDNPDLFERQPNPERPTAEALEALECLAALQPRQRDLLAGKVAGYSYRELVKREGSSYTAVNRHLTRARARVREEKHRRES